MNKTPTLTDDRFSLNKTFDKMFFMFVWIKRYLYVIILIVMVNIFDMGHN